MGPFAIGAAAKGGAHAMNTIAEHDARSQTVDAIAATGDAAGHNRAQMWRAAGKFGSIAVLTMGTVVGCSYAVDRGFDTAEKAPGIAADAAGEIPKNFLSGLGDGAGNALRGISGGVVDSLEGLFGIGDDIVDTDEKAQVLDEMHTVSVDLPDTLEPVSSKVKANLTISSADTITVNPPFMDPITKERPGSKDEVDATVTSEVLLRLPESSENITINANSTRVEAFVEVADLQASVADPVFIVTRSSSGWFSGAGSAEGLQYANYVTSRIAGCAANIMPLLTPGLEKSIRGSLVRSDQIYATLPIDIQYTLDGSDIAPEDITPLIPVEVTKEELAKQLGVDINYLTADLSGTDCDMTTAVIDQMLSLSGKNIPNANQGSSTTIIPNEGVAR